MRPYSRRTVLGFVGAAAASSALAPVFARGVEDRKFVFIILRGGLDGLAALIPDDREVDALRGAILPDAASRLDLGNGFRLHPSLSALKTLYDKGEAAFVHAAASGYRGRSHLDRQDALETLSAPGAREGWLNRALAAAGGEGLAIGHSLPLALKGPAPATNWSPPVFAAASDDLLDRLADLYADDPVLAGPLAMARAAPAPDVSMGGRRAGGPGAAYAGALGAMGRLMAADGGPGVGMASLDGWDTHAGQPAALSLRLAALDRALAGLKDALQDQWAKTAVVFCSEFGRTAAANGTKGTDHGTGGLVMLAGGAVRGGRVLGDWPGLETAALYEGRDLAPANDVAGVLKGVMRDHLGVDRRALDNAVFPGSGRALDGLIRA